ncbi:MAG: universal stress protein [Bacteroidota bacterium]
MTNVLVPTDFSENAWNAISYGVQFFKAEPTNFYLLHVGQLPGKDSNEILAANSIVFGFNHTEDILEKLQETSNRIEKEFPNTRHKFYAVQEHSFFIDGVKKSIDEFGIDFVLMGTKGASGLKEVTVGSKTGEVITRVKCPILVIPERAEYKVPKKIVFPTDFNSYYKNKVLLTLAELLAINDSFLHVLHMTQNSNELSEVQKENKDFLADFLEGKPHRFHLVDGEKMVDILADFIEENKIDMITMVAKNINFFQRLLFKPSVAKISYHTKIPFLVLHE